MMNVRIFFIAISLAASQALLCGLSIAGDEGEKKSHVCPACLQEAIADLTEGGGKTIEAGPCPECKKDLLIPLMGEKICPECAKARCACARCLIATGWNKDVGKGVKAMKGRIFFTSSPEGANVVFSVKPDGTDVVKHTRGDFPIMDCSVSPDGAWLSFTAKRDGNWEIYMCDVEGKNLRRLTKTPDAELNPSWFPNGETLLAIRSGAAGNNMVVLRRDGGPDTPIDPGVPGLSCGYPEVSADGKRICFVGSTAGQDINAFEIWAWDMQDPKNPAKGKATRLTDNQNLDSSPAPSPDGKRVAFVSNRNGDDDIFVMEADGKKQVCVYKSKGIDGNPCWSPDGKNIVFFSLPDYNDPTGAEIFVLNLKTGKTTQLTKNAHKDLKPRWR